MPLGVADSDVVPASMTFVPDTLRQRTALTVLTLYAGAFLAQALCVLHPSDMESHMGTAMEGPATHAPSSMAMPASSSVAVPASFSMAAHSPSQHGGHSGAGPNHSGVCAVMACGSAVTTTLDDSLGPVSGISTAQVAYLGGAAPPEAEMIPPPPRLG